MLRMFLKHSREILTMTVPRHNVRIMRWGKDIKYMFQYIFGFSNPYLFLVIIEL